MTIPSATYRLQFRGNVDFRKAADLVPYLARLGVSHLYASPLFQAAPGSSHGYDVVDFGKLDDCLGDFASFETLSAALREHGLGLILDIVPNHMAASSRNPWWADVLRHGRASRYATYFDVDWSRPKLLLPILAQPYGLALEAAAFAIGRDGDGLTWRADQESLPLDPRTWSLALGGFPDSDMSSLTSDPAAFRRWQSKAENAARLDAHLSAVSRDLARMHEIHEAQNWRLAHWRAARDMLGYRRFFEISDLVGLCVERPAVFDDVHRFLFELVERGHVDGLRVDHIDGLADPTEYLDRLNDNLPRPVPVWVEKILGQDERLPAGWRVAGTTGYEFLAMTSAALTNGAAGPALTRAYAAFCDTTFDYPAMQRAAKREVVTRNLAAELETLVELLRTALATDIAHRDWGPDTLRRATVALLVAMPVYRTYFSSGGGSRSGEAVLAQAAKSAREDPELDDPTVIDAVAACLERPENPSASGFRTRFQQASGALMAKAVEDTLFYRFNRLISANEVGADPDKLSVDTDELHVFAAHRAQSHPMALNATATHDTKRGEDARMRIAAISEGPHRWNEVITRVDAILASEGSTPRIDANSRWLFYQALLASWRPGPSNDFSERIGAYLVKAAREAKLRTSWVKTDRQYEQALKRLVDGALACAAFRTAFADYATKIIEVGERKSLVQLALKLTLPGVPDIYQGTEAADLSFVDPDNRRPVDFEGLRQRLSAVEGSNPYSFDERKLALLHFGLYLRRERPEVFAGSYRPLQVEPAVGSRTLAFARTGRMSTLVVEADLSGCHPTSIGRVSVTLSERCDLGTLIADFPPSSAGDCAFEAYGVSLRLFAR
jgi:(1->4)-alpha-D-glucan 1-alpha-D-glucosylmutase